MSFHQPSVWFLLLLLVLPLLWRRWRSEQRRPAVHFSSIEPVQSLKRSWAVKWRWIVPALRTIALALLIIAIARPRKGDEQTRIKTEGIAIQLVVDRSGSMRAMDFQLDGRPVDRLTAVKKVVEDFVIGGEGLPGRPDDLIGAIVFGTFADSICPITSDHAHLIEAIRQTRIATQREEGETAIGDAIGLAVERLRALEDRVRIEGGQAIKSKVMILLTDGENNAGDLDPLVAAQMAAAFGIKIYTIGAGTNGLAPLPERDFFGNPVQVQVRIDEASLTRIAQATGGQYFRATDTDSLRRIYEQIDQLEKTKIHERRYVTYAEAAVQPVRWGPITLPPLLPVVIGLLFVEVLLSHTRFRTLP